MNRQAKQAKAIVAAIASPKDQGSLQRILGFPEWEVRVVRDLRSLNAAVRACSCGVVITDTRLLDGHSWKDVLDDLEGAWIRPQLIVADRLANEALWAEVLNLGAYDLLATPFEPTEVQRVVSLAWDFRIREAARARDKSFRETLVVGNSFGANRGFAVSA